MMKELTHNAEPDLVSSGWRGRHLALVESLILQRDPDDPELPEVGERNVMGGEAHVRRVRVPADRQKVQVTQPHPRNLGTKKCAHHTIYDCSNVRRGMRRFLMALEPRVGLKEE